VCINFVRDIKGGKLTGYSNETYKTEYENTVPCSMKKNDHSCPGIIAPEFSLATFSWFVLIMVETSDKLHRESRLR
jgi:hypothetical protein